MKKATIIFICAFIMTSFVSCKSQDTSDIPADIEISHNASSSDRVLYEELKQVEDDSTIIVEVVAGDIIDQTVSTFYFKELDKTSPAGGYTLRECEVIKVYDGDVEVGDTVVLLQDYYIWDYSEDESEEDKHLHTSSYLMPAVKGNEYLMFLIYDDRNDGYWPVCDYEGMFSIPISEEQLDPYIDVYDDYDEHELLYLDGIYNEVADKYFSFD